MDLEAMKIIIYIIIMGNVDNQEDLVGLAYSITLELSKINTEKDLDAYMSSFCNLPLKESFAQLSPEQVKEAVDAANTLKEMGIL